MEVFYVQKNKYLRKQLFSAVTFLALLISTGGVFLDNITKQTTKVYAADLNINDFSLNDVTMLDNYCTNAFTLELSYLLSLDTNKLLAGFRENAKLRTNGASRYGGWEEFH